MLAHLFGRLRWSPRDVWRATPREVAAAFGHTGGRPLRSSDLRALMERFPDAPNTRTPDG